MVRCALFALLLILSLPARAGEKDIVVGVEELDYYPMYALLDNEYVGAFRDIFDAFAKDKGYAVTYRPLPIKRLFSELRVGAIDAKFPDQEAWGTDFKQGLDVTYSKPVIDFVDGVMVPPGQIDADVESIRLLGTVSGFTPDAWVGRIRAGAVTVKENPRLDQLLRQVVLRRVDGAYVNVAVANHRLIHGLGMPGALVFNPHLPHAGGSYRLSSGTRPGLIAEFDAWMDANGDLVAKIKDGYGAETGVR